MSFNSHSLARMIAPTLTGLGYDLVRVLLVPAGSIPTLQVMIERQDERSITVDDCTNVSHALSALLDVEDPMNGGSYRLEVSSPGIDRPLTRPKDFERYKGFVAKIETRMPIDGRKRFQGKLTGCDANGDISMDLDDGATALIAFEDVTKAKLVLTDELMAAALKQQEQEDADQSRSA